MIRKNKHGEIEFLMISGGDLVRHYMAESDMRSMLETAREKEKCDTFPDFPFFVNGKYYFPDLTELPKKRNRKR